MFISDSDGDVTAGNFYGQELSSHWLGEMSYLFGKDESDYCDSLVENADAIEAGPQ